MLVLSVSSLIVAVTIPEIRCKVGLDAELCQNNENQWWE